ncbi:MAG: M23 family metallopeptidase [Clostridiaceae bacterium]|nr:M23 family metallopeptidase [Clostridiaceae bacterium]
MDEIDWEDKAGGNDKIDGKDIGLAINPGESTNTGEDAYTGKEGAAIDTSDVFGAGPGIASEEQKLTLEEGSSISYDDDEDEDAVFLVENDEENNSRVSLDDEASKPDFIMPVYGNIIHDYAMDKLVYSKTLEDWRTHGGIDIAASRGTAVKAVAGGVVYEIRSDPRLGYTIVIDHENGFKTVYANLASPDMVLPNQIVEQGDSIGSVGDTAVFEIALEPHLHFEVLKNDELVDPKLYLPEY